MDRDFETFLKTHERRIHFQISRLNIPHTVYDEFYAEGVFALWQAYKEYESQLGDVGTFLNYRIRFRLIDLVRKRVRKQDGDEKVIDEAKIQLDDGHRHRATGMPIVSTHGVPLSNEPFWNEVRSHLSTRQWKWVKYFIIANLTVKEIMEIEGVSASAVKGWGREARRKLRDEQVRRRLEELL